MNKECLREWHDINPFQRICCLCNQVENSVELKKVSQREFREMYAKDPDKEGPIIFNAPPDFTK